MQGWIWGKGVHVRSVCVCVCVCKNFDHTHKNLKPCPLITASTLQTAWSTVFGQDNG